MFLTVQAMQRFRKQLLQPLLLWSIKSFQRQAAGKHLFHLQFAQRFSLNAGQNAFTLARLRRTSSTSTGSDSVCC